MIRLNNMSECWQSLLLVSRPFSLLIPLANSLHQQVGFNEFRGCRPSRSSMLTSSFSQVFSRYRLSFVLSAPEPTCSELYSLRSLLTIWTSIVQHICLCLSRSLPCSTSFTSCSTLCSKQGNWYYPR